ncbi:MAG: pentapeptide repeat-containing protein [Myxococcota bacterium]|jgi:uncharacterized protein YjbI with pentapeptide repeats|nr:pentapeptide repeat-containing protein [Myxococcota bacterium]
MNKSGNGEQAGDRAGKAALAARWQAADAAGGGSQRDAALAALRSDGPAADRPTDLRGIDLAREDLSGLDLSRTDLCGAHLAKANLSGANLSFCKLVDAVLFEATLDRAELLSADLTDADLNQCSASRTGFGGANLTRTALVGANLEAASLSNATLVDADFRGASMAGVRMRKSDLTGANFAKADVQRADLQDSAIEGADFTDTDLRGGHLKRVTGFERAAWIGTDVRDVDFCGAYLVRRHIMDENYLYEFRRRDRLSGVLFRIWSLTSDCGRSFSRWALWTVLVAVLFGLAYTQVDLDYGDHQTFLSAMYFSVVTLTTLGYGDVLPASVAAQILAVFEVVLGYVALGGLLSIFAAKMARRAE